MAEGWSRPKPGSRGTIVLWPGGRYSGQLADFAHLFLNLTVYIVRKPAEQRTIDARRGRWGVEDALF